MQTFVFTDLPTCRLYVNLQITARQEVRGLLEDAKRDVRLFAPLDMSNDSDLRRLGAQLQFPLTQFVQGWRSFSDEPFFDTVVDAALGEIDWDCLALAIVLDIDPFSASLLHIVVEVLGDDLVDLPTAKAEYLASPEAEAVSA